MGVFMVLPFFINIGISFTNFSMTRKNIAFVGLKNYVDLLSNPQIFEAIGRTFIFIFGCVTIIMLLGIYLAMVMTMDLWGINILKAVILLPWIIPESVTSYVWKWLFSADTGMIYYILFQAGFLEEKVSFFFDRRLAMTMIILANAWRTAPFVAIMTYAQFRTLPQSHVEAAYIDGANTIQRFFYITIPWLSPILRRCTILLFVWSFNSFTIIYILTGGGPAGATTTLPFLIRQMAFENFHFGRATTLSVISLLIILLCYLLFRFTQSVICMHRNRIIKKEALA
jgi:multiple sugar transport system permease protein